VQDFERGEMTEPPYELDQPRRQVVLQAIADVCRYRGWSLFAAHVRSNHVHVVVDAPKPAESVMHDFKSYASRALNLAAVDDPGRTRWARHGSVRDLRDRAARENAIRYVCDKQGEPMELLVPDMER
jgi:REP element-mobilizing transposase RayT